jgi:hypothetical protein
MGTADVRVERRVRAAKNLALVSLIVLVLGACSGGLTRKLCGAVGQPCCASAVCGEGARCGLQSVCQPCGELNQLCCVDDECQGELACSARTCVQPLTCPTQCTLGTTRCGNAGGVESCRASGVCPEWTAVVTACPSGTSCRADAGSADCVAVCEGTCTPSTMLCTVAGLQECVQTAADTCPTLRPKQETNEVPVCMKGTVREPDFIWESPVPFRAPIREVAGGLVSSFWVLDTFGNIIRNAVGDWSYELRVTPGKEQRALSDCGLRSYLFSAGEAGVAFLRYGGTWEEEFVGEAVSLSSISCTMDLSALAVGKSENLFVRRPGKSGAWWRVDTGFPGPFNAVSQVSIMSEAWLVGPNGTIVRCAGLDTLSVTCTAESSGVTAGLHHVWGDDVSGRVFAVGEAGTALSRGTLGTWAPLPLSGPRPSVSLRRILGFRERPSFEPSLLAVGDEGAFWTSAQAPFETSSVTPAEDLSSLMILEGGHTFIGASQGTLWYSKGPSGTGRAELPTVVGGRRPITETLTAVTGAGKGELFAVGAEGGRYLRKNASWTTDTGGLAVPHALLAVLAVSSNEVYAAGANGSIYVRRQGQWSIDSSGLTTAAVHDLAFDGERIYAVGAEGLWLEKSRTGGAGWNVVTHGLTQQTLYGVATVPSTALGGSEVIVVGGGCLVLSKRGGAVQRLDIPACPGQTPLHSVSVTPNGAVLIGGENGLVLERFRGATEFTADTVWGPESFVPISRLVATNDSVWAVLFDGDIYRRVGTTWRQYMPNATYAGMYGAWADSEEGVFFVGAEGQVWRRPNPP